RGARGDALRDDGRVRAAGRHRRRGAGGRGAEASRGRRQVAGGASSDLRRARVELARAQGAARSDVRGLREPVVIARIARRLAIAWVLASACALAQVPGTSTLPAQDWREIRSAVESQRAALVAG